jgi:ArsR family transcriptional regulator
MTNDAEKAAFFKALGDEVRLCIVKELLRRKKCTCICELAKVAKRDQSVIFRHVKLLEAAGILDTKSEGKYLMCRVKDPRRINGLLEE